MSYKTWTTYGYGIEMGDYNLDLTKLPLLLEEAPEAKRKFNEWLDWNDVCVSTLEYFDFVEYGDGYGDGVAKIISEVVWEKEHIHLDVVSDYNRSFFLLYTARFLWECNDRETALVPADLDKILTKYISMLTDEEIKLDYYEVENGGL